MVFAAWLLGAWLVAAAPLAAQWLGGGWSGPSTSLVISEVQAVTIANNGTPAVASPATIIPTASQVELTCLDAADGCTITVSETDARRGALVTFINAGTGLQGSLAFVDTPGVIELAGPFTAGTMDTLTLRYLSDRWVELGRSNN